MKELDSFVLSKRTAQKYHNFGCLRKVSYIRKCLRKTLRSENSSSKTSAAAPCRSRTRPEAAAMSVRCVVAPRVPAGARLLLHQ